MKNLFKLFGLMAFVAVIGFGFIACPAVTDGNTTVALTVSVVDGDGKAITTATAGGVLTAKANKEGVTYVWKKDGTAIASATAATYTLPANDAIGTYTVTVSKATDETAKEEYTDATSAPVMVDFSAETLVVTVTATIGEETVTDDGIVVGAVLTAAVKIGADDATGVTYKWVKGNTTDVLATTAAYTPTEAGDYKVTVSKAPDTTAHATYADVTSDAVTVGEAL